MFENNLHKKDVTYLGITNGRTNIKFGIKQLDRSRHIYVIGKTGTGKSTLLETIAKQDCQNGEGFIFIDPHGSSAEQVLEFIPENRIKEVIYFNPADSEYPMGFNILEDTGYDKRHLVASSTLAAFKKIWGAETWSDRMSHILNNTMLALLEYPNTTLLDINKMFAFKSFRNKVVNNLKDPQVRSYWLNEFARYSERMAQEATPAIQNKIGQFTSNPIIRNIIGQSKSSIDLRDVIDNRKILIINLSKGLIGTENASLLGTLLTTKIYLSALGRAELTREELEKASPCNFIIDEFQSFATDIFADILSEARKYKLNLVIAHQYITQMNEEVQNAVFGNVGTMISFRIGPFDAEVFAKLFAPHFLEEDFVNLNRGEMYISLMINGVGSSPFSATNIRREYPDRNIELINKIIHSSRKLYAINRDVIERSIKDGLDDAIKEEKNNTKQNKNFKQYKNKFENKRGKDNSEINLANRENGKTYKKIK